MKSAKSPICCHTPQALQKTLVALAVASLLAPAMAQQASPTGDATAALPTVTVTAQKREQLAQDVPISMTVVSPQVLERTRAGSLEDLQQLVPGFSMENQAGMNTLTVRGVGGGGRNIGFDPRVGVYLDGIFIGQAQGLRQPLFDVEQVEVLRGPQGHLFGRNTVAGAVNITTAAPAKTLEGYGRLGLGNYGAREGFVSVSTPIAENLYGKLSMASESRDGFTTNLYNGEKFDDLERRTVRAQLLYQANSQLQIRLAADRSSTKQKLANGEPSSDLFQMPLIGGPAPRHTVNANTPSKEFIDLSGVALTGNYTLASGQVLTAIVGHRNTKQITQQDNDYTPADLLSTHYDDRFKQSSQELRIASPSKGSVRYVAGLYHLTESADTNRVATVGQDVFTTIVRHPLIPVPVPIYVVAGTLPGSVIANTGHIDTDTTALFGALDLDLTSALTLNLGARYTHESKKLLFNLDGSQSGNFGIGSLSNYRDARAENKFSPTLGATYALSRNQNIYAKYARGFKSGGWNVEFLSINGAKNPAFNTETVEGYEIGSKGSLLDGRLNYDVAAYSSQFKNYQVFQFVALSATATSIELRNAAQAQARGLEASSTLRVSRNLDLGLNLSSGKAIFKQFNTCSPLVDCTGHRLPYAPDFTSALTLNYRWASPSLAGRLDLYGEASYRGSTFMDPENYPDTQAVPSHTLVNLRATYSLRDSRWSAALWVHNAANSQPVTGRGRDFLGTLFSGYQTPRTYGLELKYAFD